MESLYLKSKIKYVECKSKVIQFVTIISYKLNKKDAIFAIFNDDTNYTFTLKPPLFDSGKESSSSLRRVTYEMDYSRIYHGNITDRKDLSKGSWALIIISYVKIHASI